MRFLLIFLCLLFMGLKCGEEPNPPDDDVDASCTTACSNLEELKCPGWNGSPGPDDVVGNDDDLSCEEACEIILEDPSANLFTSCTTSAETCDAVDRCFSDGASS
jgi:hypothetical protein